MGKYLTEEKELAILQDTLESLPLFKRFKEGDHLIPLGQEDLVFIRSNRFLKLAHRHFISSVEYEIIKDFIMYEILEFRFAVFMLYYFGLRMSEIVCITNMNVRELVENGYTYIASTTIGSGRYIYLPWQAMKEMLDFESEIWETFLKFRVRKSRYVMADFGGIQFSADTVVTAINRRLQEILEDLEIEDTRCWTVGSFRTKFETDLRYHGFFGLRDYENKWFYEDEPDIAQTSYAVTYYGAYDEPLPHEEEREDISELVDKAVADL